MTKQHFEQVAEMFRTNRPSTNRDGLWAQRHSEAENAREEGMWNGALFQWETCVEDFASVAAQWNPRFDRARFLRACGHTR